MGNTLITFTYSVITRKNPEYFKIPDTSKEMNKLKTEMLSLQQDQIESKERQVSKHNNYFTRNQFYTKFREKT